MALRTWTVLVALAVASAGLILADRRQSPDDDFARMRARGLGLNLYIDHCATCHGRSGHGDGPSAEALAVRPTDLTRLTDRNGGVFPAAAVTRAIDGADPVHRSGAMPRWGDVFRAGAGGDEARQRLDALTLYVEYVQARHPHR
jgi:mono/diheme cytochrome c family protein